MYSFLKRYLRLRGDEFDGNRMEEFDKKVAQLTLETLPSLYETNFRFNIIQEILINKYSESEIDIDRYDREKNIYLDQYDSYILSKIVRLIISEIITSAELENTFNNDLISKFKKDIPKYIIFLNYICKKEPLKSSRLQWMDAYKRIFKQLSNSDICCMIDYAQNYDGKDSSCLLYALKEIFLSKDIFNAQSMLMLRNGILKSKYADEFREYVDEDPIENDVMSIFATDVKLLLLFFDFDKTKCVSDIRIRFDEKNIFLITENVLMIIYVRRLINILLYIITDLPTDELYKNKIGLTLHKYYLFYGKYIYMLIFDEMSVQDVMLYMVSELHSDIFNRIQFEGPIARTEKFESFASSCQNDFRFSKYDNVISNMLEDAKMILSGEPDMFHDQLTKIFSGDKRYSKYFKQHGFKTILSRKLKGLIQNIGIGRIRGIKK